MASPLLAVLLHSGTQHTHCEEVACLAGAAVRRIESPADVVGLEDLCGVVVVAGGEERAALGLLREMRKQGAPPAVVVGSGTEYRVGIALLQAGAQNYFSLPHDLGALRAWMLERVESVTRSEAARTWAAEQRIRFDFSNMIGRSEGLRVALERATQVIPQGVATVLITGETGTGKDLLAKAIHYDGPRAPGAFVEVNCTALPANLLEAELFGYERGAFTDARAAKPGLFEMANGGTLFMDEIGDLSLELQAKLLKVLEDKRVRRLGSVRDVTMDVRIVAATHVELHRAVKEGAFRRDLFYRLNVAPLHLPPLRERDEDVILLAEHFLERFSREYSMPLAEITPEIRRALLAHDWPGNIRELKNSMERAVLFGEGRLHVSDLFLEPASPPVGGGTALPFPATLREIERAAAHSMVDRLDGNKTDAAKALGISRKHLYALLREDDLAR